MHVINARNVHEALPKMLHHLEHYGEKKESRYGNVIVAPTPVTTVYSNPNERVMFWKHRDINPFFHLFEALWMLAGRNDVAWLAYWNKRMAEFADYGDNFHGAYGHRWREHFGMDQLDTVVQLLTNKPNSRRAVIQMFDCRVDLHHHEDVKDIPCNTIITVWFQDGRLDLTVFCRSNDVIWGAAGTNAVHFAVLQEYLAARLGVPTGTLYQISNNFHAYEELFSKTLPVARQWNARRMQPYRHNPQMMRVNPVQIVSDANWFDSDLDIFMHGRWPVDQAWYNKFFPEVAVPMHRAFQIFREGTDPKRYEEIHRILEDAKERCTICKEPDWLVSSLAWMVKRENNALQGVDGEGV